MKPFAITTALFSLVSAALAGASTESKTSKIIRPADFKPPQVFQNANLVHVISLEKNYVKEQINVLVENVAKEPQTEYYVPFTTEQLPRVGGFEVKDRKDANAGPFVIETVEYDANSDVQYYRIQLPTPLKPGAQQTLGITYYYLKAYTPSPTSISQRARQFLAYDFSVYAPSAYTTKKQKTEIKAGTSNIPDYTKLPGSGDVKEYPVKQGSKLIYGPFEEKPAGAVSPARVRFEFQKPVTHVKELDRDIEVSHWGGNIAFEEYYDLHYRGANLTGSFSRGDFTKDLIQGNRPSHALSDMRVPLQVGSVDAYYVDVIGNISTSRFRSNKREALLELKLRYPLFGGWKAPFTIGWNSDASNFLRKTATGGYVLRVPFIEGPKQLEGIEYEQVNINVLLPEGAENVKFYTNVPESSIMSTSVDLTRTYLDTVGRTHISIKARNLVDEFRDRHLIISYDAPLLSALRKPLIIFASAMAVFVTTWALVALFCSEVAFDTIAHSSFLHFKQSYAEAHLVVNMNRALSIRSNKSKNSGASAGSKKGGFSFNSLRGQVLQPELSRKLFRLIKSENNLIGAHETAGRERVSIATQLSEWGEHTGDDSISDISDKVGVVLSEMGEQEDTYAHALDESRTHLKAIRNTEKSVQPSRENKDKIADEIQRLKLKEPGSTRLPVLEQELVRAEAENLVAEAQLTNITRQKLKEAYAAEFAATIERAEKQIILAKHGRRLLELLDDSPVVPGDTRGAYQHSSQARQILNDAEDDLRDWRPEPESFSTPIQSRSPTLEGKGKEPQINDDRMSPVQSEAATLESETSPQEQRVY
ncbi:hypothetical protein FPOA_00502 [Fusarium poae]|uniref:Dolichyl-diphosphooligosaccharide--protein glycosyltransferase subunit 1 n=1 Tax=Fusarium poae TaxID=36050 RepID=A0A1B8B1F3_FUSPO|nr:hypothetical protein FPOA_00502 [Fusarium poae]